MKSNSNKKTSKDSTEKKKVRETIKTNLKSFQIKKKIKKKKNQTPKLGGSMPMGLKQHKRTCLGLILFFF